MNSLAFDAAATLNAAEMVVLAHVTLADVGIVAAAFVLGLVAGALLMARLPHRSVVKTPRPDR